MGSQRVGRDQATFTFTLIHRCREPPATLSLWPCAGSSLSSCLGLPAPTQSYPGAFALAASLPPTFTGLRPHDLWGAGHLMFPQLLSGVLRPQSSDRAWCDSSPAPLACCRSVFCLCSSCWSQFLHCARGFNRSFQRQGSRASHLCRVLCASTVPRTYYLLSQDWLNEQRNEWIEMQKQARVYL